MIINYRSEVKLFFCRAATKTGHRFGPPSNKVEQLGMHQLIPGAKLSAADTYRGPVSMLRRAFEATESLGSLTVVLAVMAPSLFALALAFFLRKLKVVVSVLFKETPPACFGKGSFSF